MVLIMNFMEKQSKVLDLIKQYKDSSLTRLHFAWSLPIPENIIPQPFFRITFIKTDNIELRAAFNGKIETRKINPGEAIFFRLYAWDNIFSPWGTESLAIVYRPDFIRIVLGDKAIEMHNPHSLSSAGMHTLQLLDSLAQEKNADQQLCCDTAKLLLDITRRDFALPIKDTSHAFDTFLEIKHFVSKHYGQAVNRDFTAEHFGISSGYISQLFKRYSNSSFGSYLTQLRLNKAEYFLLNTPYQLSKIAKQCGFSCDVRLIKTFRQHYGTTPSRFRLSKKHQANLSNNINLNLVDRNEYYRPTKK